MGLSRLAFYFNDSLYFQRLVKFAIPIALQQLLFSSLNLVASVLVGQLGGTAIAAVALANQIFFLLNLTVFGMASGAAMFTAQLWGKRDIPNIRRVLGIALTLTSLAGLFFLLLSELFPAQMLSIYSKDNAVIELGIPYLRVFGISFIFFAVSLAYSLILRSIGQIRISVAISVCTLALNIILSYILIFGKFGFPSLGVQGAAWSILISRVLELFAFILIIYRSNLPLAGKFNELFSFDLNFTWRVLKPVLPIVANEILWSLGITAYQIIYARMGTDELAAVSIAFTIDGMAVVAFIGIGNATAIMIGNLIGEGEYENAQRYGGRSIVLGTISGVIIGALVFAISPWIINLYKVSPQVIVYTQALMISICALLWLRMMNLIMFLGIFRAGGDTRLALLLDGFLIWAVGVPLTAYAAFVLQLPVYLVYLFVYSEEIGKWSIGLWRYFSKRWIHNLTETV